MNCKHRYWNRICVCGWRDWEQTEREKEGDSLQILLSCSRFPLTASPPKRMRRKAKHHLKASCAKKSEFSWEAELTGSTKQMFFFFWNDQGAWTVQCRVTQQAAQIQEHWSILHWFPTGSSTLCCAFTPFTGVTSFFLSLQEFFPKQRRKEKWMQYLVNQYQIHQSCIKFSQLLQSLWLLSSCHSPAHPPLFAQSSVHACHSLFRGIRISLAGLK